MAQDTSTSAATPLGYSTRPGSYDHARRRRTKRAGREKGCWVYIAADELEAAGYEPGGELPWYRVWGTPRGVVLRLYRKG